MTVLASLWLLAVYGASAALAQSPPVSSFCSPDSGMCARINVPSGSSTDTHLSISAPLDVGWVGVGLGSQMAGALIFVVYPDESRENVTVSPRLGKGHVMPQYESSIRIAMLEGTGISGDTMQANFVCRNCRKWRGGELDVTASDASFIWAIGGSSVSIASDEKDESIRQHSDKGQFSLDVAAATGGDGDANPFPSTPTTGDDEDNSQTGGAETSEPTSAADRAIIAHGVLMALTWIVVLPFGAALIRMLGAPVIVHRIVQVSGFLLAVTALILGVYASGQNLTHFTHFHQYFGVLLVSLLVVQAALGQLHHQHYVRTGKRSLWSYGHIWLGRAAILCAIINGGIGLGLAGASAGQKAAYSLIAIVVVGAYAAGYWWTQLRRSRRSRR